MKKALSWVILVFLGVLSSVASSFAVEQPRVYVYTLNFRNVFIDNENLYEFNIPSMMAAKALKSTQLGSCIDLRIGGSGIEGNLMRGSVEIVMNSKMKEETRDHLLSAICVGSGPECDSSLSEKEFLLRKLRISAYVEKGTFFKGKPTRYSLKGKGMIPQFSAACDTGRHSDSWNNTASTDAAQAYLRDLGIELEKVRTLELVRKNGDSVYTFGFPSR